MAIFKDGLKWFTAYKDGQKIYQYIPSIVNVNVAASANGGVASASSYITTSSGRSYPASNANDSSTTTNWQAKNSPTVSSPEWLRIDFSQKSDLNTINLIFISDGIANDFILEYLSNNGLWKEITTVTGINSISWSCNFDIIETTAIKITITKSKGTVGPKVAELEAMYRII